MAPNFGPRHMPDSNTNSTCRVMGTKGKGIRIQAPTAVRHTNKAADTIDFVFKSDIDVFTSEQIGKL